jgi:beta-galactosidase
VPTGSGITGLWRPEPGSGPTGLLAFIAGDGTMLFSLKQDGSNLAGNVEGGGGGFFGGADAPNQLAEGKVDGNKVSFKAGNSTYSGTVNGDRIELERMIELGFPIPHPEEPSGPRPAIGPPPDGSDPSIPAFRLAGRRSPSVQMVLHRVQR